MPKTEATHTFTLTMSQLEDLQEALGDAYAYRVGEDDIDTEEEDMEPGDVEGARNAQALAKHFGLTID